MKKYRISDECHSVMLCIKKGPKRAQKDPKECLNGGCAMDTYLTLTCTYLVSNSTYYCKLSFNGVPTGEDHCDICLAGVWLHKERFLRTSSIVIDKIHEKK